MGDLALRGRAAFTSAALMLLAAGVAIIAAVGVVEAPAATVAATLATAALCCIAQPAVGWVAATASSAILLRGLVGLGLLPGYAQFIHIPLAWMCLAVALLHAQPWTRFARQTTLLIGLLATAILASSISDGSDAFRGVVYLGLLGQPFAVIAALLLDPPTERQWHQLRRVLIGLVAVQVPIAYGQAILHRMGDPVQGTLYGSQNGAHILGAILLIAIIWYIATRQPVSWKSGVILAVLIGALVATDAKQVVFALPAAILAQRRLTLRTISIGLAGLAAVFVVIHVASLNKGYTVPVVDRALNGQSGKELTARTLWHEAVDSPTVMVFGHGPAETVSRTAFQTLPTIQKASSDLSALHLHPARETPALSIAAIHEAARWGNRGSDVSSVDSAESSALGVFGDLGVAGTLAYLALAGGVFVRLRRTPGAEAAAAAAGFAVALILGFMFDWWEQPPFTLYLAALAGLALTQPRLRSS